MAETIPAWRARPEGMSRATWRTAKIVSFCGNPVVVSIPCFAAVSYRAAARWPERLRWWAIGVATVSIPPFLHIRHGVRTGRFSDHEVSVRQERFWPYMAQIGGVLATYGLMRALRAPREMVALVVSVAGAMVAVTGITLLWKISMHVVGASGAVAVLILLYGKRLLPLAALVPLVGWSRYVLEHHTPAQIAAGALLGAASPLLVFHRMGLWSLSRPTRANRA